jgi:hypothetical protein
VINVAGQVVSRFNLDGNNTQDFNLNQPSGIYIISIQTQRALVSKKIFIQ